MSVTINTLILLLLLKYYVISAIPFRIETKDVNYLYKQDNKSGGGYELRVTERDSTRVETGKMEKTDAGEDVLRVGGHYTNNERRGNDDVIIEVHYKADENGFRAVFRMLTVTEDFLGDKISTNCAKTLCGGGIG